MSNDVALEMSETTVAAPTVPALERWLIARLAEELGEEEQTLDPTVELSSYGLDSMSALVLTGELEEWLEIELPSTLVWDYTTIRALAGYLEGRLRPDGGQG
jgi:acyl carrier protein